LERADAVATAASDREHVTPLLRRHSSFRAVEVAAPIELRRPELRLTVDTPDDLAYLRAAIGPLYDLISEPSLKAIIYAADMLASEALAVAS
jgi:spore coat polysaccharide biosynthesis protein SpsF